MDPREDYFGLGQDQDVVAIPLPALPACASQPGIIVFVSKQGVVSCTTRLPESLSDEQKRVPACGPGTVPLLDTRVTTTTGSGWSCAQLASSGTGSGGGKSGGGILLVVGAAVLAGAAWLLLRGR